MYQYILVHTSMYSFPSFIQFSTYILKCDMYWYIPVHTGKYLYVPVCTCMYWYIPACTTYFLHGNPSSWWSTCWNIPLHPGTCQHVLISFILAHCHTALSSSGYKPVQGGTRQYPEVPYPWIVRYKEVQGGTRPCTALYLLVLYYSGVQDFWVLPCTALYRLVSRRGQGSMTVNQNEGNEYMLACTSM